MVLFQPLSLYLVEKFPSQLISAEVAAAGEGLAATDWLISY